jgi:hypothetical protein
VTVLDVVVLAWLILAAAASAWAHRLAWQATPPEEVHERRLHRAIGCLAALYTVGYGWLLTGAIPLVEWSRLFRGVSLIAFPLVWVAPALLATRRWRQEREAAAAIVRASREVHHGD